MARFISSLFYALYFQERLTFIRNTPIFYHQIKDRKEKNTVKIEIHDLKDLKVGDTVVLEHYHTGIDLADYWYKRPWRVENIYVGNIETVAVVIGLNKNDINRTSNVIKDITNKMLDYAKLYKLTTTPEVLQWINNQKYTD